MGIFSKCGRVTHTPSADTSGCGDLWPRYVVSINIACFDLCCKGSGEKEAQSVTMHKKKNAPTTQPAESWQLESRDTSGCWCLHHFLQKIESNCRRIIYWELYLNGLLSSCLAVSSRGWTGCKHETMSKATVVTTKSS